MGDCCLCTGVSDPAHACDRQVLLPNSVILQRVAVMPFCTNCFSPCT